MWRVKLSFWGMTIEASFSFIRETIPNLVYIKIHNHYSIGIICTLNQLSTNLLEIKNVVEAMIELALCANIFS